MFKRLLSGPAILIFAGIMLSLATVVSAQTTNGSITIQTMDATKALLPGTHLVLTDNETNVAREGTTLSSGTFTFTALPPASYHLTVEHDGFSTVNYDSIVVQAGVATPLNITLKVGTTTQEVNVSAVSAPVIETSSNQLSTSVNLEEVNDLPVNGRSLLGLQALAPGYSSATGTGTGTFNGTAAAAYGASIDGVDATSLRMDAGSGSGASINFRTENIQEFTVQSGELDPSQGGGRSAAQTLFVTNRGTNKFHGRAFEDFRNAALNANSWSNDNLGQRKAKLILNDFGGTVGGPIFRDKLFFFGSYSQQVQPGASPNFSNTVPTAAAQLGNYTYCVDNKNPCTTNTINVLQMAHTAGFDNIVNPAIDLNYNLLKTTYQYGTLSQLAGTQLNTQTLTFTEPLNTKRYYPSARLDYTLTKKLSLSLSGNMTKTVTKGQYPGEWPGPFFQQKYTGSAGNSYVLSLGANYTITPNLLNHLNVGYLYTNGFFSPEAVHYCVACQGNVSPGFGLTGPNIVYTGGGNFYPYLTLADDLSWQKGRHTVKFGGNAWHQQDHYYNGALGYYNISLGMGSQDAAYAPIEALIPGGANCTTLIPGQTPVNCGQVQGDIAALYAYLNGRVSDVNNQYPANPATGKYDTPGRYNLDEVAVGGGVYLMDTWRVQPSFTLNYGLRWDFIGDQHDLKNGYTGPSAVDLFGSSGLLNVFQPGANSGPANPQFTTAGHKYHANLVLPQPQIGFAWNPAKQDGWVGKLFGDGKTVIRGSFTLKNYTEGGQNFWNNASNAGFNFYSNGDTSANGTSTGAQYFTPGTVHLSAPGYTPGTTDPLKYCTDPIATCINVSSVGAGVIPAPVQSPPSYQKTIDQSSLFFTSNDGLAINPNIKQPYTESWSFGIQRQISRASAIEIRYVGNRSLHDWLNLNYNETNGLNNGFLQEFVNAQKNLATNIAAGKGNDFTPYPGDIPTPILSAAFAGISANSGFKNSSFITNLNRGAMGSLVNSIATNQGEFCNVVGKQFAPCATTASAPATSIYPSNFFKTNAFLERRAADYLDSVGSSNYNALQVEFRQQPMHGVTLDANYTYAKTLGIAQQGGISSFAGTIFTLHNLRLNYVPSAYDIRNTLHLSGTYALPFGQNKMFLSGSHLANYFVGGWTLGGIFIYQSGAPSLLTSSWASTVNSASDGGVTYVGANSAKTIQSQMHIRPAVPGVNYKNFLPASLQTGTGINASIAVPNTTPGVIGNLNYLYGPKWNTLNMSVTKDVPVFEHIHMNLQAEAFNLPNHPAWLLGNTSISSATFGTTGSVAAGARQLELRANITF
jgi:hypothetical protein